MSGLYKMRYKLHHIFALKQVDVCMVIHCFAGHFDMSTDTGHNTLSVTFGNVCP